MLQLVVNPGSVTNVVDYVERVKLKIFAKMREGMEEAMEGLGGELISQAVGAGIQSRTGKLFEGFEYFSVRETADLITGRISPKREMKLAGRTFPGYVGTALDEGFHVKPVEGKLFQFTAPSGDTLYSRGHVAFDVRPHPFFLRAKEAFTTPIMEIIEAKVAEAYQ